MDNMGRGKGRVKLREPRDVGYDNGRVVPQQLQYGSREGVEG